MATESGIDGRELRSAIQARLTGKPISKPAVACCQQLAAELLPPRKHGPTRKQTEAVGALIADLLERDPGDRGGWLYMSIHPRHFTGKRIGHRVFLGAFEPLQDGWLEHVKGTRQFLDPAFVGSQGISQVDWATRFRASSKLRERFTQHGISHLTWGEHFARERVIEFTGPPVELRAPKIHSGSEAKRTHKLAVSSDDPRAAAMIERMSRLNTFLAKQEIEPFGPVALRRIFNNATTSGYGWDQGGRLQAIGGSYQSAKKELRASMTINGETVLEIDVRASHLSLMAGLGILSPEILRSDPYEIEGLPRDLVKQWVTMTIGNGKRHTRWPGDAKKDLESRGILTQDYPLRSTGDAILARLPMVNVFGETLVGWGTLQFLESESLLSAVETLAYRHGVVSLPVHDSLIVRKAEGDLAAKVLIESFKAVGGIEPALEWAR